jgi:hypothetical protein
LLCDKHLLKDALHYIYLLTCYSLKTLTCPAYLLLGLGAWCLSNH